MRKYAVAVLAIPVLALVYVSAALRTSALVRTGVAVALGGVIGLSALSIVRPDATRATGPSETIPLTGAAFRTIVATGFGVHDPAPITFTTAMDRLSVEASLEVQPPTPVDLIWSPDSRSVSVVPTEHWAPGTLHTISILPGALAQNGRPTTTPARATFLTREPSSALLSPTNTVGKRVAVDTRFSVAFDAPIDLATLAGAVRLDPPVHGAISTTESIDGVTHLTFTPSEPLAADRRYELVVEGVRDADGLMLDPLRLQVRTVKAPSIVRFRPGHGTKGIERGQDISVRFTRSMDRAATKRAFEVTVNGKPVKGTISFAEDDTVLVFDPAKALPWGAKVVATVKASAQSDQGAALGKTVSATFRTEKKPRPVTTTRARSGGSSRAISRGGGGSSGSGSWLAVERYYLRLMNCTRTGGWVTSGGRCSSPGGRNVAPLKLSAGISSRVARPYAKRLARGNDCSHFIGGNPGDRLRRAGYTNYTWAENISCRSGNPYSAVLGSHRFFQSEKSYNGGHYVNLMNRKYDRVGIGVWVASGRVRLVVDFYHP